MDEITYWIYTKQAPCLMSYDNVIKKQFQATRAQLEVQSCHTISDDSNPPLPPQKKRRKLSILEDSGSTRDPQNVYFESSNQNAKEQTVPDSGKSESTISDIDLNTKKSPKQDKQKRLNISKKSKTRNRSNKIVSSTPKVDAKPRRSLRNSKKCLNDDSALETSLDIFDVSHLNGHSKTNPSTPLDKEHERNARHKKIYKKLIFNEDAVETDTQMTKNKNENNKYDDMSDVSGFTANYIRSTRKKVNTKNKVNQNLFDEPKRKMNNTKMIVCMNKGVNTGLHQEVSGPNCSTDSTNCLNLMTTHVNNKQTKVNRSTSILKFMPIKHNTTSNSNLDTSKETNNMTNGSSRYPKRFKNSFIDYRCDTTTPSTKNSSHKRKNIKKMYSLTSTKKENNTDSSVIKTRSRRSVALQPSETVLVITNSTEQISTPVSLNVASPKSISTKRRRRKRSSLFLNRNRRSGRKSNHIAGLSDSEDEKPLRPRYFS